MRTATLRKLVTNVTIALCAAANAACVTAQPVSPQVQAMRTAELGTATVRHIEIRPIVRTVLETRPLDGGLAELRVRDARLVPGGSDAAGTPGTAALGVAAAPAVALAMPVVPLANGAAIGDEPERDALPAVLVALLTAAWIASRRRR
ncbi:MAG TPA: hypothetical protein VEA81_01190 [Burkholderiaceae bacterium]|nr:hypothetical protein [Burkholderiaceae bacterium]